MINHYPYTDQHELNLDWILKQIKRMREELNTFEVLNSLTFAGVWDISKQYTQYDIVTDGNIGYLSVKPVPAGIDITNTEYWVEIFDLEMQIAESHNTIIISDSYGVTSVVGSNNWAEQLKAEIIRKYDATVYTSLHGARGFVPFNITDESFLDSLKEFDSLSATEKKLIKNIIVCGGANDGNQLRATVDTNVNAFCSYAKANYPNADIYIGMIGYSTNPSNIWANSLRAYQDCPLHGARYLSGVENALRLNNLKADGIHPTSDGNDEISRAVINSFFTGSCDIQRFTDQITFTPSGICTGASTLIIEERMINDMSEVRLMSNTPGDSFTLDTSLDTWSAGTPHEIGTLSGNLCASSTVGKGFGFHTHGYFRDANTPSKPINDTNMMFELWLGQNNKVYLSALGNSDNSHFWGPAVSGVAKIELNDVCIRRGSSFVV